MGTENTRTHDRPGKRAGTRRLWKQDLLEASAWLIAAGTGALFLKSGTALWNTATDVFYSFGRLNGIAAASLVMFQFVLISRTPFVERVFGHDRTAKLHTKLGKVAFLLMLVHVFCITLAYAQWGEIPFIEQFVQHLTNGGWELLAANIGLGLFIVTVGISLKRIRPRWKYENWHAVHLFMYVAIAAVIPHQFLRGPTFYAGGFAWWYWFSLYALSIGLLLTFRLVVPLVQFWRRGLVVREVSSLADGSTSVLIGGRGVAAVRAKPGQFFLWRFLAKGTWFQSHPYSLSRAPGSEGLRITVKPSGDGSSALAKLRPGTRVLAEGPLGVFHHGARVGHRLVLISAGIGITPIRSMLEAVQPGEPCTVIVRARSRREAPLIDEVEVLAAEKGAELFEVFGPRGRSWGTAEWTGGLAQIVPDLAKADVFICGPEAWAREVEEDAREAGVPSKAIHREAFAW